MASTAGLIPELGYTLRASWQGLSITLTCLAPASRHSSTTCRTTAGLALAPISGGWSQAMLGLTTTTSPGWTNFFMPPRAWIASPTTWA